MDLKTDFLIALKFFEKNSQMLIVARVPFPTPLFSILKEIKRSVFIIIRDKTSMYEIADAMERFAAIILSDMHLNNFEIAFLSKYCERYSKRVVILSRTASSLPFMSHIDIEDGDIITMFCEDLR